ncbi:MAG: PilZ domain-containing protein [Comamonadaceae bacterium]|nr:PilZ domain-containing protein [Comamonadaceae bacterium]
MSLEAVLYHNSVVLHACVIRDISADGVFVLTGGQRLPEGAQVDLAVTSASGHDGQQRVGAEVVRVTDQGLGLRLKYRDPIQVRALVDMLYAA